MHDQARRPREEEQRARSRGDRRGSALKAAGELVGDGDDAARLAAGAVTSACELRPSGSLSAVRHSRPGPDAANTDHAQQTRARLGGTRARPALAATSCSVQPRQRRSAHAQSDENRSPRAQDTPGVPAFRLVEA